MNAEPDSAALPVEIDPTTFAERARRLRGRVALRLPAGEVGGGAPHQPVEAELQLRGGVDGDAVRYISGSASADVTTRCQRCLDPLTIPLRARFLLGVVADDAAAAALDERYEPLLNEPLRLTELAVNELLLVLPLVPKHAAGDCQAPADAGAVKAGGDDRERRRPFAGLADLLKD